MFFRPKKSLTLVKDWALLLTINVCFMMHSSSLVVHAAQIQVEPSHIGTFEGTTTFTTISENDAMPSLFIEVKNQKGELTQYYSEEGIITIPNTNEGTYITQAKMFGRTLFQDVHTRELLTEREAGRTLELISPQNPRLTIIKNNLIVLDDWVKTGNDDKEQVVTLTKLETSSNSFEAISNGTGYGIGFVVRIPKDGVYKLNYEGENVHLHIWRTNSSAYINLENTPLQKGETLVIDFKATLPGVIKATNLSMTLTNQTEPISYKSSVIRSNQTFNLRQIRENRDELDLITKTLKRSIGEKILIGNEEWHLDTTKTETQVFRHPFLEISKGLPQMIITDDFEKDLPGDVEKFAVTEFFATGEGYEEHNISFYIAKRKSIASTVDEFKRYLTNHPVTIQYTLSQSEKNEQTIELNHTYLFPPVSIQKIKVVGEINPTVISLTFPAQPLSFLINPNQSKINQFIAPTFTISNDNYVPLTIELKEFKQITSVFNDVLPDYYESWEGLNREESKYIALSITPKPSDGWLNLNETSYYVANHSPQTIGTIKGKSSVEFTFSALHGISFAEPSNPQYQLTFVFDLLD